MTPVRIAVAGATGVVGRHVVTELGRRGHDVVPLSRSHGVDVTQFDGLADRLAGADAVIDTLGIATTRRRPATAFFTTTTRNLLEAEGLAGVGRHVLLSIVGIDGSGFGYYRAKVAQEDVARTLDTSTIILRATQFHEFAGQLVDRSPAPLALAPRMLSQPVAAAEVAALLVATALGAPQGATHDLGGPQPERMDRLVRAELRRRGTRRVVVPVPMVGTTGRQVRDGGLLPGPGATLGRQTFDEWAAGA